MKPNVIFVCLAILLGWIGCGETPPLGGNGGSSAAGGESGGGAGGEGGGTGGDGGEARDCETLFDEGAAFVALAVEDFDGATDLTFSVDGCAVEPLPAEETCPANSQYYLKVPIGPSSIVVDSPQGLRWKVASEPTERECVELFVRLGETTTMFEAVGIGDGAIGQKTKFPVEVLLDGEVIGNLYRLVDDDALDHLLRGENADFVIREMYRIQSEGWLVVIPINDAPHFIEYDGVGILIQDYVEGWVSVGVLR